jgi:uncharacterized protein YjaG (DUF416 family)
MSPSAFPNHEILFQTNREATAKALRKATNHEPSMDWLRFLLGGHRPDPCLFSLWARQERNGKSMFNPLLFLRRKKTPGSPLIKEREYLLSQLRPLAPEGRFAFMAAIAERAFPFYASFQSETGWDSSNHCRAMLNQLWTLANEPGRSTDDESRRRAENCIPDGDLIGDHNAVLVQCTPGVVSLGMNAFGSEGLSVAVDAAMAARDVADQLVINDLHPDAVLLTSAVTGLTQDEIMSHPIMVQEVTRQLTDIATLTCKDIRQSFLDLRKRAESAIWTVTR